jgi:hypothetical protein
VTIAELLSGSGQKSTSSVRIVAGSMQEMGIVEPDVGRLGTELLDHCFEQSVGILSCS